MSGYWQIEMDPSSEKTALPCTLLKLRVYKDAYRSLQCASHIPVINGDSVIGTVVHLLCYAFIDDILVVDRMVEEHLDNLKKVFERLREAGLRLKPKKRYFLREEVEYLGHVVSADGVRPNPHRS